MIRMGMDLSTVTDACWDRFGGCLLHWLHLRLSPVATQTISNNMLLMVVQRHYLTCSLSTLWLLEIPHHQGILSNDHWNIGGQYQLVKISEAIISPAASQTVWGSPGGSILVASAVPSTVRCLRTCLMRSIV